MYQRLDSILILAHAGMFTALIYLIDDGQASAQMYQSCFVVTPCNMPLYGWQNRTGIKLKEGLALISYITEE